MSNLSVKGLIFNILTENGLFLLFFLIALIMTGYYLIHAKKPEALAAQVLPLVSKPVGLFVAFVFLYFNTSMLHPRSFGTTVPAIEVPSMAPVKPMSQ